TAVIFLLLAAAYTASVVILHAARLTTSVKLAIVALVAGAAIANVALYPVGALDVFNYMIELKLAFHYGENPYLVTFEAFREDPYALPAFLVDITLFYGPAWLLVMWVPTAIAGFTDVIETLLALKIFNLVLIGLTALLIGWHQREHRLGWVAVTLFLANPLVLFEGVGNAHNDVLLTAFVVGAMIALERRSPLAGPLLALSALVKLYTVALAPIFLVVVLKERWGWKRTAVSALLTLVTVVVVCLPYWGDGRLVDGLRSGLEESQEMDHVSPLSLARQYAQQQVAEDHVFPDIIRSRPSFEIVPEETRENIRDGFSIAFAVGALAIAATVWRGRDPVRAAADTLLLLFLLMTNLYPWYLIPVIALLAMRPDRLGKIYIAVGTALGLFYYPMFIYGHYNSGWTRFQIHLFLALFLTVPIVAYLIARVRTWFSPAPPGIA
ncbi:MAG TPA: glycosyltransferase 87 family protein, partial [Thermomicrobiales bacterium]|nr:glycosyltransferase 87 family protein [Thermomicrobiales bacterium]